MPKAQAQPLKQAPQKKKAPFRPFPLGVAVDVGASQAGHQRTAHIQKLVELLEATPSITRAVE